VIFNEPFFRGTGNYYLKKKLPGNMRMFFFSLKKKRESGMIGVGGEE
jgi:hypothetical protein